jgi:CBS domain-containing protein
VAELNDRFVRRTLGLTEATLAAEGSGPPPVSYTWLAAGSEGRREQTLKTDQDNGLVYTDPPEELVAPAAAYFARLAGRVGEALIRLGFPPCDGGFMASNPRWCQPWSGWRDAFLGWMETPDPEDVLRASLFCDLRPVGGDETPGRRLWDWVCDQAPRHTVFLRYMAKAAVDVRPPLGLFGRLVVERSGPHRDRIDLKARGVFPVTHAIRVYALSLGVPETNTVERLAAIGARQALTASEVTEIRDAHEVIARLRLRHQLDRLDGGEAPDNLVDPRGLGRSDRLLLREAFRTVGWLQGYVAERFQTGIIG